MRREPKLFGGERPPPEQGAPPAQEPTPEPAPAPETPAQEATAGVAPATGGAPPWRRIAVWAAAVVAVVAAIWGGYSLLGGESAPQDIPFFTAEEGPFKVRPEEPGGTQIPNQDMLVLEGSISGQREEGLEVLLPRPEEPLPLDSADAVDVADTADTAAAGGQEAPGLAGEGEAGEGGEDEVVDVAAPAVNEVDEAAEGQALFTPEQVDALVEAAVPGEGEIPLLAVPVPGFKPAQAFASGATAAAAATVTTDGGESGSLSLDDIASAIGIDDGTGGAGAPASDGVVRVQIASYSSGGDAETAWQRLQRRHPDLLAEMEARIAETAIGNATYWRLQVGAFPRRSDADRFCDELKKRDVDCLVVAP